MDTGQELFEKYLRLLGIRQKSPGMEALHELIRAHTAVVPFENISKLYYKKHLGLTHLINFELYLDGIERYHFGGTCYANNYYLNRLLAWLGYEVKLCGADMSDRDVHVVNVVYSVSSANSVDGGMREFLVDTGYAAPFREPLPLDLSSDLVVVSGSDRYVLKPFNREENRHPMELYRDGVRHHGYWINPAGRTIEEFFPVITDSFREEATFMNAILVTRFDGNRFVSVRNLTVTESTPDGSEQRTLESREELAGIIEQRFGIPEEVTLESISGIRLSHDPWE